jgi:hypothetical protein
MHQMSLLRSALGPVVLIYNLVAYGIIFLMLSNGEQVDDVVFLASQDAALAVTVAVVGVALNLTYGYLKWRDRARERFRQVDERRPRITGE